MSYVQQGKFCAECSTGHFGVVLGVLSKFSKPQDENDASKLFGFLEHSARTLIYSGHDECLEVLLGSFACHLKEYRPDGTLLHCAATAGKVGCCKTLLRFGADVNAADRSGTTPLHCSATTGHIGCCKMLIRFGANVDAKDQSGATPLHVAAVHGHPSVIELLLNMNANPNLTNDFGTSALMLAVCAENAACVESFRKALPNPTGSRAQPTGSQ